MPEDGAAQAPEARCQLASGVVRAQQSQAVVAERLRPLAVARLVRGQGEADERLGEAEAVVHLTEARDAVLVEAPRLGVILAVMCRGAEAPERRRDGVLVAELLGQREASAVEPLGTTVVALFREDAAEAR